MKNFLRRFVFALVVGGGTMVPGAFALAYNSWTSNITTDTTWTSGTYVVENSISISSGATLTVDPGVVVKFRSVWTALTVDGSLDAEGTATSSIYFTSINDDSVGEATGSGSPAPGDWYHITLSTGAVATFNHAFVGYGGFYYGSYANIYNTGGTLAVLNSTVASSSSFGIYQTSGTTTVATSTFNGSATYGIKGTGTGTLHITDSTFYDNSNSAGYFDLGSGITITNSGNTASGTGKRGFTVTGSLGADQIWQADTIPYIISAITVPSGKILTINPNAIVKFENEWASLTINGTLDAEGTSTGKISFTSIKDDTVGGDTNSDSSATSPAGGDWYHITIGANATATLDHTFVGYGGFYYGSYANIYNTGGTLHVLNSTIASSSSFGIYHTGGTTNIATSTFNGSATYGIKGTGSGSLSIENSNFYNNSGSAGYFDLGSGLTLSNSGNTASGSGKRGFTVTGSLATDQTWQADGVPYIISTITIPAGKTLTINPGAKVKFENEWASLSINGTLNASGTSGQKIYFTSIKDDTVIGDTNSDGSATSPAPGDWYHIAIGSDATATLDNAFVGYGGFYYGSSANIYNTGGVLSVLNSTVASSSSFGIYHMSGTTTVATSTFNGSATYGIKGSGSGSMSVSNSNFYNNSNSAGYFDLGSGLVLSNSGNTASGTGKRGFIITGSMTSNQTWQADTIPYIISALTIPAGKTLTINPNTIAKFENEWAYLAVDGTLTVQQGEIPNIVNVVYFTSIKDDTIGGDTNADGSATSPAPGNWYHIAVNSGGIATIEHAFVGYGGFYYGSSADIYNNGGTLNISTTTIAYGSSYGISHAGGTTNVKQSIFRNNGSEAFHNTTTATTTATSNYWGDVSGPYNALYNPSGTGNHVSNYVDFDPWLGSSTPQYVTDEYAVNGTQLRFQWKATSTQDYLSEWDNAVDIWNDRGAVNIVEASSTVDLTVEEYSDAFDPALGDYRTETSPPSLRLNKAKLSTRAFNQIQNTATHELGHALGLLHSYWENILYARQTFQTTLGPEDVAAYNYCWVDHTNCNY